MGIGNWIMGALGWAMFGPIGGLIGYAIGALLGGGITVHRGEGYIGSSPRAGFPRSETPRNSFMASLLVLSTAVIKADGKFLKSELEFVKQFIRANFGEQSVNEALQILKTLYEKDVNVYEVGSQIRANMNYSQRIQLFHYLANLAQCDGSVSQSEIDVLKMVASSIGLSDSDTQSVLSMFRDTIDDAYKVLGVPASATDDEVRKAYKKMAMKNHPDKVATLGPEIQKAAEEKFKAIQDAYEKIKKNRGMK